MYPWKKGIKALTALVGWLSDVGLEYGPELGL